MSITRSNELMLQKIRFPGLVLGVILEVSYLPVLKQIFEGTLLYQNIWEFGTDCGN